MRTARRTVGARTEFVIVEPDPVYHGAIRALGFGETEGGFARTFPSDSRHLDRAYHNFARHAEELVLQKARVRPVPWERALLELLRVVDGQSIDWWLAGSAALAVRGLDLAPGDLDLIVDAEGAHRLGELLLDHLIEPVAPVEGWFCDWFGRAFLHACVEWVGAVGERADQPEVVDFGSAAARRLETVEWRGYAPRVPPLDLQLAVTERRGLAERAAGIRVLLNDRDRPGAGGATL